MGDGRLLRCGQVRLQGSARASYQAKPGQQQFRRILLERHGKLREDQEECEGVQE